MPTPDDPFEFIPSPLPSGAPTVCTVTVGIPYGLETMEPHLRDFFYGMVAKLHLNRHKEPPRHCDVLRFLMLMHKEMGELIEQCYTDRNDPNLFLELHDIANYAFLMGMSLRLEQEDKKKAADARRNRLRAPRMFDLLQPNALPLSRLQRVRRALAGMRNWLTTARRGQSAS